MNTVGSGSYLDLGKKDGDGFVCFQAGKTELLWSAFLLPDQDQIRVSF